MTATHIVAVCPLGCGLWRGTPVPIGFSLSDLDARLDDESLLEHWALEHPDADIGLEFETYEMVHDELPPVSLRRVAAVVGVAFLAGAAMGLGALLVWGRDDG